MRLALLALALAACSGPPPEPQVVAQTGAPAYADELAAADRTVLQAETQYRSDGWSAAPAAISAYLERARLSGRYEDYAAADRILAAAQGAAGAAALCHAAARLHFSLHRLERAAESLAACDDHAALPTGPRGELLELAGELAYLRGRYREALRIYRQALARNETLSGLARLARYHAATGAPVEALALLDRADRLYHGTSNRPRAWLALQRGLIALGRGGWDEAHAHYLHAQRLLPGWWLAREHEAEVLALQGRTAPAIAIYREVVAATGHPEYMDAIARLLLPDQPGEAREWIARARAGHERRAALLPGAAADHALDHYLAFGSAAEALALARANFRRRPHGESAIGLVAALARAGELAAAEAEVRKALASGWDTAELHAAAAQIFALRGLHAEAESAGRAARARHPQALDAYPLNPATLLGP